MDTSGQYIKMCFEAWPYLKENYQPSKGDFYKCSCRNCRDTDRVFMVNDYDYDYVTTRNLAHVYKQYAEMVETSGVGYFGAYWDEGKDSFFVIWKQDQLQGIAGRIGDPISVYINQLSKFQHDYIYMNSAYKNWTWEQIWLGFVMFCKFQKVWDGKEWKEK